MTRKIRESQDIESIHIGKIIEDELRRQERSVTWLSRKIHCDRRNIYDIFSRTSIDTDLLYRLCVALQKDFFTYFSTNLQSSDYQSITPPDSEGGSRVACLLDSCNPSLWVAGEDMP